MPSPLRSLVQGRRNTYLFNALFNAELRYLVESFEAAEAGGNQDFRTLLNFSLGRIDDLSAMNTLGIDSQEDLFLLMAQAHLPMPRKRVRRRAFQAPAVTSVRSGRVRRFC